MAGALLRGFKRVTTLTKHAFERHLLLSNFVSAGILLGVGDVLEQQVVQRLAKRNTDEVITMDWTRNGRMFIVGFGQGIIMHVWYAMCLDKFLPGRAGMTIGKKVLLDQSIGVPAQYAGLFVGASLLEGETLKDSFWSFIEKFPVVYAVDWGFWVPAQIINFRFVPAQYRVVYIASLSVVHNIFLVWMQHNYGKDKAHAQQDDQLNLEAQEDSNLDSKEPDKNTDIVTVSGA